MTCKNLTQAVVLAKYSNYTVVIGFTSEVSLNARKLTNSDIAETLDAAFYVKVTGPRPSYNFTY